MPATLTSVPICANADLAQQPAHIYRPCKKIMAEIAFFTSHSLWLEKNHISGCLLYSGKFRPVRINFCRCELFPESRLAKQWQWFRGTSFFINTVNNKCIDLIQYDKEVILFMTQDFVSITLSTGFVSRCLSTQFSLCLTPALSGKFSKIVLAQLKYLNLATYSRFDLLTLELAVMGDNCVHDR